MHGGVLADRRIDAASAAGAGGAQAGGVYVQAGANFAERAAGRRSLQLSTTRAFSPGGRRKGGTVRDDGVGTAAIGGFRQRGDAGEGARAVDFGQRTGHAGRPPGAGPAADGSGRAARPEAVRGGSQLRFLDAALRGRSPRNLFGKDSRGAWNEERFSQS